MKEGFDDLKRDCQRRKLEIPKTDYETHKLTQLLCNLASRKGCWYKKCDETLAEHLPLREHHRALITHSLFVTLTGSIVARALEEATYQSTKSRTGRPLDLLCDRYFVRRLLCHDSSKTSDIEAAAYSGIMAVFMEKEVIANGNDALARTHEKASNAATVTTPLAKGDDKMAPILTAMANHGFTHHYEKNDHHPEYYKDGPVSEIPLIEAIIDGLACIMERVHAHSSVAEWIGMFNVDRFKKQPDNLRLATGVLNHLKTYITDAEYQDMLQLRKIIAGLIGVSVKWGVVKTTKQCGHDCVRSDDPELLDHFK